MGGTLVYPSTSFDPIRVLQAIDEESKYRATCRAHYVFSLTQPLNLANMTCPRCALASQAAPVAQWSSYSAS